MRLNLLLLQISLTVWITKISSTKLHNWLLIHVISRRNKPVTTFLLIKYTVLVVFLWYKIRRCFAVMQSALVRTLCFLLTWHLKVRIFILSLFIQTILEVKKVKRALHFHNCSSSYHCNLISYSMIFTEIAAPVTQ